MYVQIDCSKVLQLNSISFRIRNQDFLLPASMYTFPVKSILNYIKFKSFNFLLSFYYYTLNKDIEHGRPSKCISIFASEDKNKNGTVETKYSVWGRDLLTYFGAMLDIKNRRIGFVQPLSYYGQIMNDFGVE